MIERTQPLTQLQLGSRLPSFRNPLPLERGRITLATNTCCCFVALCEQKLFHTKPRSNKEGLPQPRQRSRQPFRLCRFFRMIGTGLFNRFGFGLFDKGGVVKPA